MTVKYNQVDEDAKRKCHDESFFDQNFSDLSFWVAVGLDGCTGSAVSFSGKKASRKTWDETNEEHQYWLVKELILQDSKKSGLSYKDRERLYILARKAVAKKTLQDLNKIKDLPTWAKKGVEAFVARFEKIGFASVVIKSGEMKSRDKFCKDVWDYSTTDAFADLGYGSTIEDLIDNLAYFTDYLESLEIGTCGLPNGSKGGLPNGSKVVSFVRKAMKNVGLRPDSTKIWEDGSSAYQTAA